MAANPKPTRRAPAAPDTLASVTSTELLRALDDNTEALHQLRVALCGTGREPKPGGAIGAAADELTRSRGGW